MKQTLAVYFHDVMVGRDVDGAPIYCRTILAQRDVAEKRMLRLLQTKGAAIDLLEQAIERLTEQVHAAQAEATACVLRERESFDAGFRRGLAEGPGPRPACHGTTPDGFLCTLAPGHVGPCEWPARDR